jgi:hypothetical protein
MQGRIPKNGRNSDALKKNLQSASKIGKNRTAAFPGSGPAAYRREREDRETAASRRSI